jgi:hypothetical protein
MIPMSDVLGYHFLNFFPAAGAALQLLHDHALCYNDAARTAIRCCADSVLLRERFGGQKVVLFVVLDD